MLKQGDPTVLDNYRGITIMGAVMKLLLTIVARRLDDACEHVAKLIARPHMRRLSTSERRMPMFRMTCCFISHNASGSVVTYYRFLGPYYAAIARSGCVQGCRSGRLSDPIPLLRGLRQGCPASPILFNVFINDIFSGATALGCEVPGLRSALSPVSYTHLTLPTKA